MAAPPEYKAGPPPPKMPNSQVGTVDFPIPPAKRPRLSPQPSPTSYPQAQAPAQAQGSYAQHVSPYATPSPAQNTAAYNNQNSASSRYNQSPLPPSPHFSNIPASQNTYTTPYSNGSTPAPTSTLSPQIQFSAQNNFFPQTYGPQNSQSPPGQNQFASHQNSYHQSTPTTGNMGPPMKPADKSVDEDRMDILTGTGVDLREEEAYSQSQFTFSQNPSQSTTYSSQNIAGPEASFYGSGKASQSAESTEQRSQEENEKLVAEDAWQAAARKLAQSRQEELADPCCQPRYMMFKMDQIAREEGVKINTRNGNMGRLIVPGRDYDVTTQVRTTPGPQGSAMFSTSGPVLPPDNLVVDQLILLSLAIKHRTRQLLEDAVKIAKGRQAGSSGFVPSEWADLAVPMNGTEGTIASTDPEAPRPGWESAVSPHTDPAISLKRKRSNSSANRLPTPVSDGTKTPVPSKSFTNDLAKALRDAAETERQHEEERIRKRMAREAVRPGSVAPGTPGSVVSNGGAIAVKPPTRKEIEKKTKEKKKEDAASNVSANATLTLFSGNMGKKGKKKTYSWLTAAQTGGAASPAYSAPVGGNIRAAAVAAAAAQEAPTEMTQRSSNRLGNWREDKSGGEKVQMRDWIAALEQDGGANQELQRALMWLDGNTRPKRDTPENQ